MAIVEATCDGCGKDIRPKDGDELFEIGKESQICKDCYDNRFEDLVVEEEDD